MLRFIVCLLLLPLTMWYAVGVALRNRLFDWGIKRSVRPGIPTIGVGNLRVGGTGKTPHTEYIINLLSDKKVALLSRGYGRETKGFVLADEHSDTKQIGDEPLMMKRKFPQLTVAVCEDRVEGVKRLMDSVKPDVVVLDDVFQHRRIRPSLSILLTEYANPYCDDHILPFGNLREGRRGRRRADIVVVTKCPDDLGDEQRQTMRRNLKLSDNQTLFFSKIKYGQPVPLFGNRPLQGCDAVVAVTGIAHPQPLLQHLEQSCSVVHLRFPDHHAFSVADCKKIADAYNALPSERKAVITTEKDAARMLDGNIGEMLHSIPLYYLPISVDFQPDAGFDTAVVKAVEQAVDQGLLF